MRYLLHEHPAFPGLLSREDLFVLVERGSLRRGDLCTDTLTRRDHTVGEVISGMKPPRGGTARVARPSFQEIRADLPHDPPPEDMEPDEAGDEETEAGDEDDEGEDSEGDVEDGDDGGEETIQLHAHPSWLNYPGSFFLILLLLGGAGWLLAYGGEYALIPLLAALAWLLGVAIARFSTDYMVTDERVEKVWGILGRSSKEVRICDIRSIDVYEKGLLGLLGIGTVDVSSAGNAGIEVSFKNMRGAHAVKHLVRRLQRGSRAG
ncbi:MAG TPA: hypothetical protein DIT13_13155 [Verrucomicrobiales bacterium]|nr:hypothetical protein [Verrucomicrobiales bacterium]HRJ10450.1 PH domain-containing protein [Prosthecobacter sp.]